MQRESSELSRQSSESDRELSDLERGSSELTRRSTWSDWRTTELDRGLSEFGLRSSPFCRSIPARSLAPSLTVGLLPRSIVKTFGVIRHQFTKLKQPILGPEAIFILGVR